MYWDGRVRVNAGMYLHAIAVVQVSDNDGFDEPVVSIIESGLYSDFHAN